MFEIAGEIGKKLLEGFLTCGEQYMAMSRLGRPWSRFRLPGQRVALQDGHLIDIAGQDFRARQAAHTGSDDNGVFTDPI
jgi:hypothetical protein